MNLDVVINQLRDDAVFEDRYFDVTTELSNIQGMVGGDVVCDDMDDLGLTSSLHEKQIYGSMVNNKHGITDLILKLPEEEIDDNCEVMHPSVDVEAVRRLAGIISRDGAIARSMFLSYHKQYKNFPWMIVSAIESKLVTRKRLEHFLKRNYRSVYAVVTELCRIKFKLNNATLLCLKNPRNGLYVMEQQLMYGVAPDHAIIQRIFHTDIVCWRRLK